MYIFLHPDYNRLNHHSAEYSDNIKERVEWEDYSLHKTLLWDVSKFYAMSGVPETSPELVIHWEDPQDSAHHCAHSYDLLQQNNNKLKSAKGKAIWGYVQRKPSTRFQESFLDGALQNALNSSSTKLWQHM